MQGGEIFVPKIPSIKIIDLASYMAPSLKQEVIAYAQVKSYMKLCVQQMILI